MAHNGAGYDHTIILQWCIKHGLSPIMIMRQGSVITYMHFKNKHVIGIDTLRVSLKD